MRQARRAVIEFAASCGFENGLLDDIESAVGEALANAVEHGKCDGASGFEVWATFENDQLVIEIKDFGAGFDCERVLEKTTPDSCGNRGFGIFLMRELMDEVAYSENGSRIQLVKRLSERAVPV